MYLNISKLKLFRPAEKLSFKNKAREFSKNSENTKSTKNEKKWRIKSKFSRRFFIGICWGNRRIWNVNLQGHYPVILNK